MELNNAKTFRKITHTHTVFHIANFNQNSCWSTNLSASALIERNEDNFVTKVNTLHEKATTKPRIIRDICQ